MARSTWVAHAFEWEKLLKCHLKGKASRKLANGQNIDYSEKIKWPKGFICPYGGGSGGGGEWASLFFPPYEYKFVSLS